MARKRQRVRTKPKVTVESASTTVRSDVKENIDESADSGNDSPGVDLSKEWRSSDAPHKCAESIKAWTFYQACILERYHWYADKKRRMIVENYSDRMREVFWDFPTVDLTEEASELQMAMDKELMLIDNEESIANRIFRENIKALESGTSIEDLPPIDAHVTLDQISKFITKYTCVRDDDTRPEKEPMNLSFSSASEDSGVQLHDMFGGSLLSDDIWKPDNDLFNGSFTIDSFYQPPSTVEGEPVEAVNLYKEEKVVEHQPTIAEQDSAIKAVVYLQEPAVQSAPHLQPQTQLQIHPQMQPLQADVKSSPLLSNWENSLKCLSNEYTTNPSSLSQPYVSAVTNLKPSLVSGPTVPVSMPAEATSLSELSQQNGVELQNVAEEVLVKSEPVTAAKLNKAPVKFADCKPVDSKEQEKTKAISFTWTAEAHAVPQEKKIELKVEAAKVESKVTPAKKPTLSFAAVAATPAAPVVKEPPAKTVQAESSAVYSTKKPTRKFSKSSCLNKTSMCWTFIKTKKCPWGDECIFAHGKNELRPLPKWFKKEQDSINKNNKVLKAPHSEPCNNQSCYWRRQYFLRKTDICKLWESERCPNAAADCRYAHGQAELKPLPKLEMCRMFINGKCNWKATECVYAHDKSELQSKKRKKSKKKASIAQDSEMLDASNMQTSPVSRLRTISEASTTSQDSWSAVVARERVRTISGTSLQSSSSQGMRDLEEFDWEAWNSQSEVPANEELDYTWNEDECVICALGFSEDDPKHMLQCEHDNFHRKCISQWLAKDETCPICRNPTDVDWLGVDELWHLE